MPPLGFQCLWGFVCILRGTDVLHSADVPSSSGEFQEPGTMGRFDFDHRKQVVQSLYWFLITFEDLSHLLKLARFV